MSKAKTAVEKEAIDYYLTGVEELEKMGNETAASEALETAYELNPNNDSVAYNYAKKQTKNEVIR